MRKPLVFNIQKYSIHDGEGIRTTIFFKGCPLSCLWCHNPESQRFGREVMIHHNLCVACGNCVKACPRGACVLSGGRVGIDRTKCGLCGKCTDVCLKNAREIVGRTYEIKELVREAAKDQMFYEQSGGGVTLSGGEVMAQDIDYIEELCARLNDRGINVNIDTCGYTSFSDLERVRPFTDVFLYDIKAIDPDEHRRLAGVDNKLILDNLIALSGLGARINIRLPLIKGMNADTDHIADIICFLRKNDINPVQVNLLPYHNTGRTKYENLDREYRDDEMHVPSAEDMEAFRQLFLDNGFLNTKIGG